MQHAPGQLALDFGQSGYEFEQKGQTEITPTALASACQRAQISPFIILDIPVTPSLTECVRQLCLRNAFAAQVINAAPTVSILATGLADFYDQDQYLNILLADLSADRSMSAMARRMWYEGARLLDNGISDLGDVLSYLGTALFTANPDQDI